MATPDAPAAAKPPEDSKAPKPAGILMPLAAVFVLMPALAFGLTQYVLVPKIRAAFPTASATEASGTSTPSKLEAKSESAHPAAKKAKTEAKGSEEVGFEFKDVIVNLSGALGTRYLKASFTVTGSDSRLAELVKADQKRLLDIAISVLSSRTLNDLDSSTAKSAIREELIAKFNHVLEAEVVEEIYFSEFVIQ